MKPPVRISKELSSILVAKPQALLVLGMHRSGTSALTRVLNLLGCALPTNLIGAGDGNEVGHWESVAAVTLNDEILASAGSTWEDWGPINQDWRNSGMKVDMLGRVAEVVREHAALGPLFALKDPRLCRLADLWLEACDFAEVESRVVLMVRNPAEVSASLEQRDLMAPGYGKLLWLRHVLDAEHFSRGRPRVVCRYDQLMRNWHEVVDRIRAGLGLALPRNTPAVHVEVDKFLSSQHRHHALGADAVLSDISVSAWLRRTFSIMLAWSEQGENSDDHAELDQIRREFDQAYSTFARLLLGRDVSGSVGSGSQLKRQLSEQLAAAQHATEAAAARQAEIDELRREAEQAESLRVREAALLAQLEAGAAQAGALQAEIEALRAERVQLAEAAAEAEVLRARELQLTGAVSRLEAGAAQAYALQAEIEALRAGSERLLQLSAEADALRAREAALTAQLDASAAQARALQDEIKALRSEVERSAQVTADLDSLRERAAEQAGRASLAESALAQRQEELSQLWNTLLTAEKAAAVAESRVETERERRLDGERRVEAAVAEITELTNLLREQEALTQAASSARADAEIALARQTKEIQELKADAQQRDAAARAAESARRQTEQKLAARFDEIARLTMILADEGSRVAASSADAAWLRDMMEVSQRFPKWWALLPVQWRQQREQNRYRRAGLFDAEKYLETYPDVAADGMDPVRHYILHGITEGRRRPQ